MSLNERTAESSMPSLLSALNPGWLLMFAGLLALLVSVRSLRQGLTIAAPLGAILLLATGRIPLVAALVGLQLYGVGGLLVAMAFAVYGLAVLHGFTGRSDDMASNTSSAASSIAAPTSGAGVCRPSPIRPSTWPGRA